MGKKVITEADVVEAADWTGSNVMEAPFGWQMYCYGIRSQRKSPFSGDHIQEERFKRHFISFSTERSSTSQTCTLATSPTEDVVRVR
jgi:hypothetical protein